MNIREDILYNSGLLSESDNSKQIDELLDLENKILAKAGEPLIDRNKRWRYYHDFISFHGHQKGYDLMKKKLTDKLKLSAEELKKLYESMEYNIFESGEENDEEKIYERNGVDAVRKGYKNRDWKEIENSLQYIKNDTCRKLIKKGIKEQSWDPIRRAYTHLGC